MSGKLSTPGVKRLTTSPATSRTTWPQERAVYLDPSELESADSESEPSEPSSSRERVPSTVFTGRYFRSVLEYLYGGAAAGQRTVCRIGPVCRYRLCAGIDNGQTIQADNAIYYRSEALRMRQALKLGHLRENKIDDRSSTNKCAIRGLLYPQSWEEGAMNSIR